jgi:transcriptional regulator with XRE-family HTH domain
MDLAKLGSRIKLLREKRRLRQVDIASALRLSAQAVSKWERGENAPDIAVLVQLAHLLGVSVEWLLTGNEDAPGTLHATVFATYLCDYAERAMQQSPAVLANWINVIHYAVTEAVLRAGGVPIKCVGDGFLGFFSGDDQASRALIAAREAKSATNNTDLVVVLNAGPVFLGTIGHPDYARSDVIGATVNTTFLLAPFVAEHCPTRIGVTQSVVRQLGEGNRLDFCGETAVLGVTSPVAVFVG